MPLCGAYKMIGYIMIFTSVLLHFCITSSQAVRIFAVLEYHVHIFFFNNQTEFFSSSLKRRTNKNFLKEWFGFYAFYRNVFICFSLCRKFAATEINSASEVKGESVAEEASKNEAIAVRCLLF